MPSTGPVVDGNFDSKAGKLLIMAEAHRNVLHVKNYQRWPTHLSNRRLNYFLGLNIDDILLDQVDRKLTRSEGRMLMMGCRLVYEVGGRNMHLWRLLIASTPILPIIIVSPPFRTTSICIRWLLLLLGGNLRLQSRNLRTWAILRWALQGDQIVTTFAIASRAVSSASNRGTLRPIPGMSLKLGLRRSFEGRQLSRWSVGVLRVHNHLGLRLHLLWGGRFSSGTLAVVDYLLTHVICRVDSDQIGQFGLSLIGLHMVHLCRGCDQSRHVNRFDLRPLIGL